MDTKIFVTQVGMNDIRIQSNIEYFLAEYRYDTDVAQMVLKLRYLGTQQKLFACQIV